METEYAIRQKRARLKDICGKFVYPWLVGLAKKNKEEKAFPLCLGDYYGNQLDKEVAEAVALLVPFNKNRAKYMTGLHNMLGDSPWEMVKNRAFLGLMGSQPLFKNLNLTRNTVVNILDWFWDTCYKKRIPLEYVVLGELGVIKPPHEVPLTSVAPVSGLRYKLGVLLAKMTLTDDFGVGMWSYFKPKNVPCPICVKQRKLLRAYYPICGVSLSDKDAGSIIDFIGFEKRIDFLYAYWEYERLAEKYGEELKSQEEKLLRWNNLDAIRFDLFVSCPEE